MLLEKKKLRQNVTKIKLMTAWQLRILSDVVIKKCAAVPWDVHTDLSQGSWQFFFGAKMAVSGQLKLYQVVLL